MNCGTPVFAMADQSQAVLLVGYDAGTVTIFDPAAATTRRENLEEAAERFEQAGNLFLAYLNGLTMMTDVINKKNRANCIYPEKRQRERCLFFLSGKATLVFQ